MSKSAIVVIAYNRPASLQRLLASISLANFDNDCVDLILSCDFSGKKEVYNVADNFVWKHGNKVVIKHKEKLGLKKHVLTCLSFAEQYSYIFVLEDDLIVSDSFYVYGKGASSFYDNDSNIAAISLYSYQKNWLNWALRFEPQKNGYDTYFMKLAQSWGEVFTKSQWLAFNQWLSSNSSFVIDSLNPETINQWPESSWLKFFVRYCILENKYLVYPYHGLSSNCSDLGENNSAFPVNDYQVDLVHNQNHFSFPFFDAEDFNCIKYDEYMNRVGLEKFFQVPREDLIVDLWGTKQTKCVDRKYLLTTKKIKSMEPLASFSLAARPIEYNIVANFKGDGIYLYFFQRRKQIIKYSRDCYKKMLLYSFRTHDLHSVGVLHRLLFLLHIKYLVKRVFRRKK